MQLKRAALIPLIAIVFTAIALSAVTAGVLIAQQNDPAQGHIEGGSITTNTVNVGVTATHKPPPYVQVSTGVL